MNRENASPIHQKNEIHRLTCEDLGADMAGVCRLDGQAVFVSGLLPGETADVRLTKVLSRYAFGRVERLLTPNPALRRENDCPAYPRCGGCAARHMTYAATLEAKRAQVADCFRRIGHLDVDVLPVLGMEQPDHYRNKTALPIGGTADAPVAGFFAPRSHAIIPAESCPNAMPPAGDIAKALLRWMRENRVAPYDERTRAGLIRHLVVRVSRLGQAMAVVVVNGSRLPGEESLVRALTGAGATSVLLNPNREDTNVILGRQFRTLHGPDVLTDTLCGFTFEIAPAAFFQVNPAQAERLYETAVRYAELRPEDIVCDVYCGAGTISLALARHCRQVVGIEIVPAAVENAKQNARRNGVTNTAFHAGAAEEVLPRLVREGLRPDVLVVDPPRKGLEPAVIEAMAAVQPRSIVYVSCNAATQARDAALLAAHGYRPERVQPVDMFCWTEGVETVCCLYHQKKEFISVPYEPKDAEHLKQNLSNKKD